MNKTLPDAASLLYPIWRTHCMWRAPLALFLLYRELFTDRDLREARTLEYFTTLPDAASLLHHMWCTHCVWRAPLTLFLLYRELFSNRDLFTDCELRGARTLKNFTTLPDAASLLHPMWHTHFVWRAPLPLFLLYHELFSDRTVVWIGGSGGGG